MKTKQTVNTVCGIQENWASFWVCHGFGGYCNLCFSFSRSPSPSSARDAIGNLSLFFLSGNSPSFILQLPGKAEYIELIEAPHYLIAWFHLIPLSLLQIICPSLLSRCPAGCQRPAAANARPGVPLYAVGRHQCRWCRCCLQVVDACGGFWRVEDDSIWLNS